MGRHANNSLGYWRVYTDTVTSGTLALATSSLEGTVNWSYGCITFSSTLGYAPAPLGEDKQVLTSDGGTIVKRSSATSEPEVLTGFTLVGGNTSKTRTFSIFEIGNPAVGTIFTIEGSFKTADGFSINFEKTSFQKATVVAGGYDTWVLCTDDLYTPIIDCGVVKPYANGTVASGTLKFDVSNEGLILGAESQIRAYNGSGTIKVNGVTQTNPGGVDFRYHISDGYCTIWGINGKLGMEVTVEGLFSVSHDPTKVLRFPQTVFKVVKGKDDGTLTWVVAQTTGLSSEDYVSSGVVSIHDNSALTLSAEKTQVYFKTEDVSLPKGGADPYNYMIAKPGESSITYQNPGQEELDLTYRNNILYSIACFCHPGNS
jgi:hypothetical protein